jgi:hypothetical protein
MKILLILFLFFFQFPFPISMIPINMGSTEVIGVSDLDDVNPIKVDKTVDFRRISVQKIAEFNTSGNPIGIIEIEKGDWRISIVIFSVGGAVGVILFFITILLVVLCNDDRSADFSAVSSAGSSEPQTSSGSSKGSSGYSADSSSVSSDGNLYTSMNSVTSSQFSNNSSPVPSLDTSKY